MYKYQSKCKFRMLTTIGEKIVEIRPKQIIESNIEINNDYLVLINTKKSPTVKRGRPPKEQKTHGHSELQPADTEAST